MIDLLEWIKRISNPYCKGVVLVSCDTGCWLPSGRAEMLLGRQRIRITPQAFQILFAFADLRQQVPTEGVLDNVAMQNLPFSLWWDPVRSAACPIHFAAF